MQAHIHLVPIRKICPSLPATMKGILMSIPGVSDASVEYESRSIEVSFDPTRTSAEAIIAVIGKETGVGMWVE